jgi:hypothetical protein
VVPLVGTVRSVIGRFRLEATGGGGYRAVLDDFDLSEHIDGVSLGVGPAHQPGNTLPRVVVNVIGLPDVDLPEANVIVSDDTADALTALGWSPPSEQVAPFKTVEQLAADQCGALDDQPEHPDTMVCLRLPGHAGWHSGLRRDGAPGAGSWSPGDDT